MSRHMKRRLRSAMAQHRTLFSCFENLGLAFNAKMEAELNSFVIGKDDLSEVDAEKLTVEPGEINDVKMSREERREFQKFLKVERQQAQAKNTAQATFKFNKAQKDSFDKFFKQKELQLKQRAEGISTQ